MSSTVDDLFRSYKQFILRYPKFANEIESGLRWVSFFTSGRFKYSQLVAELLYTSANLMQLLNDTIIRKANGITLPFINGKEVEFLQTILTLIEYIQVFAEFFAKQISGEVGRWLTITVIQFTKAVIKLCLLYKYNQGIQKQLPIQPLDRNAVEKLNNNQELTQNNDINRNNNVNVNNIVNMQLQNSSNNAESELFQHSNNIVTLKRSGRQIRSLETAPPRSKRTWTLKDSGILNEQNYLLQVKRLPEKLIIGETLHILRPMIHLASMRVFGEKAWTPYYMALGVDLISLRLLNDRSIMQLTPQERIEIGNRYLSLLLYLLRSPFFDKHTKERLLRTLKVLSTRIPLFGKLLQPLITYLPDWQRCYFNVWMI